MLPEGWAAFNDTSVCGNRCPPVWEAGNPCYLPVNPAAPLAYQLFDGVLAELTGGSPGGGLFPEALLHLGGDEVQTGCWASSPSIGAMMAELNYTSYADVYLHFVRAVQATALASGRLPVHWEEVCKCAPGRVPREINYA